MTGACLKGGKGVIKKAAKANTHSMATAMSVFLFNAFISYWEVIKFDESQYTKLIVAWILMVCFLVMLSHYPLVLNSVP